MRSHLRRVVVGAAVLGFVVAGAARAQEVPLPGIDNTAFGTTTAEFLLLGAGARGAALGSNYAAIATDPTALYWNPAGIANIESISITANHASWLADTKLNYFPFTKNIIKTRPYEIGIGFALLQPKSKFTQPSTSY